MTCRGRNGHLLLDMCSDWVTLDSYSPMNRPSQENLMSIESESKEEPNACHAAPTADDRKVVDGHTKEFEEGSVENESGQTKDILRTTKDNLMEKGVDKVSESEDVHVLVVTARPAQDDIKDTVDPQTDLSCHGDRDQQGGGPGKESNQAEGDSGAEGREVGLEPRGPSGPSGPSDEWSPVPGATQAGAPGEGVPLGGQRLWSLDNMYDVPPTALVRSSHWQERHSSKCRSDPNGRDHDDDHKRGISHPERFDHSKYRSSSSRRLTASPIGGGADPEGQVGRQEEDGEFPISKANFGLSEHGGHSEEDRKARTGHTGRSARGRSEAGSGKQLVASYSGGHAMRCGESECISPSCNNLSSHLEEEGKNNENVLSWETPKEVLDFLSIQTEKNMCGVVEAMSAFFGFSAGLHGSVLWTGEWSDIGSAGDGGNSRKNRTSEQNGFDYPPRFG